MSEISRAALFGKLDVLAYKAIEGATAFCKLRGNPFVELQHWLRQILEAQDSDLHRIVRHYRLDAAALAQDLTASLDRLPRGASSISDLSIWIESAVERGWVYGSLMFRATRVRTGHLVIGMLKTASMRPVLSSISKQFDRIRIEDLAENFERVVAGSPEEPARTTSDEPAEAAESTATGGTDALKRYAVDLTARARAGEIDPVMGRAEEIRQVIDVLMRRRQNNPILTGEAGVGKTAVVEGFALRIVLGDVPPSLKDVTLYALDVGLLQAGASMKGEFESRLRSVIDEVRNAPKPIILFIDEAHTLVGAGGAAGTGDAANLLKPALARGELRTIAATTWAEYKKHIEKDPALTRRFQVVQVSEPSEERAVLMLRGVASVLEKHHRVALLDDAIEAAVRLSHRYIPARQLPDKAVSLLDTACARVAISQHATPPELEDCLHRIEALQVEREIIEREAAIGIDADERRRNVLASLDDEQKRLAELQQRISAERTAVDRILALRARLRAEPESSGLQPAEREALLQELATLQDELHTMQGETPLILPSVDEQAVASVVQDWTGIPLGRMVRNDVEAVLQLSETLNRRVVGQSHALSVIARCIQTSRAKLDNPNKPTGVFLLCGTSGVGKTETALALAEALYGGEQNVITINMSEYQEAHTVSTLKGAPPGYVGYGEGGVLTEAVRRQPYSVVLLDEVEKAHPDVHELFFQVFDKGWMEDGEGRYIDFRNTIVLLTSNVGSDLIMGLHNRAGSTLQPARLAEALRGPLLEAFPAALLGRVVTIPYLPLDAQTMQQIVRLQLDRVGRRFEQNHGARFSCDDDVVQLVASRCSEAESGGRVIERLLADSILPRISAEVLTRLSHGRAIGHVGLAVKDAEIAYSFD